MKKNIISFILLGSVSLCWAGDGLDGASKARLRSLKRGLRATRTESGVSRLKRADAVPHVSTVGGFLMLNDAHDIEEIASELVSVTETRGGIYLVQVNIDDAERIAADPAVMTLRLEREVRAKMDKVRSAIGADRLHNGEVLNHAYTGKGVLCGSVDGGFDPNHLNFKNAEGSSRIQNFTYFRPTQAGTLATENYGPEYIPVIDTENSNTFHGTHTLGIMAGGYKGKIKASVIEGDLNDPASCRAVIKEIDNPYYGIACDADIAVASGVSTDYYIAMGVNEILNYAWHHQEDTGIPYPVVINISMGSNLGPHDGSSFLPKYLDSVCEEEFTNNAICVAAGNEGNLAIALNHRFSGEETTLQTGLKSFNPEPEDFPNVVAGQVYVYSDTAEPFELQATVYNRQRGSVVFRAVAGIPGPGEEGSSVYYATSSDYMGESSDILSPQLAQYFEGYIGVIGFTDTDESGRYMGVIDAMLWETPDNGGNYVLVIQVKGKDGQRIDMFADGQLFELDDLGLAEKDLKSGSCDGTIADTATGKNVIVVGSYNSRDAWASLDGNIYSYDSFLGEEVSYFSSWGKLIDGRELPHVCAPGATIISSSNEYYIEDNRVGIDGLQATVDTADRRYSWHECIGTSMSTPVVSGGIALWKEADPELRYDDIQEIIRKTAIKDADVTADPTLGIKWGAGKFNAFDGLVEVLARKGINGINDITSDPGDQFILRKRGTATFDVLAPGVDRPEVSVYSLTGSCQLRCVGASGSATVDATSLPKGVYLLTVNGIHTEKIYIN